jgi:hypothetical protein
LLNEDDGFEVGLVPFAAQQFHMPVRRWQMSNPKSPVLENLDARHAAPPNTKAQLPASNTRAARTQYRR